jgi:hypothetical protein
MRADDRTPTIARVVALLAGCALVALTSTNLHVLWYPQDYVDVFLALLFGVSTILLGGSILLLLGRRERLVNLNPRSLAGRIFYGVCKALLLVIALGGALAFASACAFSKPLIRWFGPYAWGFALFLGVWLMFVIARSIRRPN